MGDSSPCTCYENLSSDATKGANSLYVLISALNALRFPLYFLSIPLIFSFLIDRLGRHHLLNTHSLVFLFSPFRPSLPRFPHCVYNSCVFFALLCLSSALADLVYHLPSLGSGPPYDATVSLGCRVLKLLAAYSLRRVCVCVFVCVSIQLHTVDTPSPKEISRVLEKIVYRAYYINSGALKEETQGVSRRLET